MKGDQPVSETLVDLANRLNPVTSGPAAPLQAGAALDSFGPSLMPRSSLHQGIAGGVAVLIARAIGLGVDAMAAKVAPKTSPLAWRVGVRAALAGAGAAVARLDRTEDEFTPRASVRSAGRLLNLAAWGGSFMRRGTT